MAVASVTGGRDQPLDLAFGEVLARPGLGVRPAPGRALALDCPKKVLGVTSARCGFLFVFTAFPRSLSRIWSLSGHEATARLFNLAGDFQAGAGALALSNLDLTEVIQT
jgi:hypothetical protein